MPSSNKIKSSRQSFQELLSLLRIFCQVFCAVPVIDQFGKVSIKRRLHKVWCLTVLVYIYVVNYTQARSIPPQRPTIEKALLLSKFVTNCAIATALISSAYYYAEQYRRLPQQLQLFNIITSEYEIGSDLYEILYRELRLLSLSAGSFLFSCFIIDFMFVDYDIIKKLRTCGSHDLPNLLATLNLAQYWLALRFICLFYKRINDALERLQTLNLNVENFIFPTKDEEFRILPWTTASNWYSNEFPASTKNTVLLAEFLDYLRGLYSDLDNLLAKLVDIFSLIILLNFFGSFLDLAIKYFAIYKFYDNPDVGGIVLLIYKLLSLVLHTGKIFFILLTNHAITKEKSRTYYLLNELPTNSQDIEHAINRFHFLLMVRKSVETACGIIDLDLIFLGGFNSALALYVTFLIQIDLGNVSKQSSIALNITN